MAEPPTSSSPRRPEASFAVRAGSALGLSAAGGLACALPAALRISSAASAGTSTLTHVWVAIAAAELAPMLAAVVVLRGAREGLRALAGEGAGLRLWGLGVWVAAQFVVLTLLGSVLRAHTHQHALAGVTYAFAAIVAAAALGLVSARVVAIVRQSSDRARRAILLVGTALVLLAVAVVGMRFLRAVWREPAPSAAAASVIDVLAFALAALFASRPSFAPRRAIAVLGSPVAVALALLGVPSLREPSLRSALEDRAPLLAPLAQVGGTAQP